HQVVDDGVTAIAVVIPVQTDALIFQHSSLPEDLDCLADLLLRLAVCVLAMPFLLRFHLRLPCRMLRLPLRPVSDGQLPAEVNLIQSRRAKKIWKTLSAILLGFQVGGNMFIFHPLDVLCLAGGVAAKTPDRLTLDLQRPWDRNAMGLFGFAELMKVRSAPFHTPIQLRDGRGIAATDDQVILGHAQWRQIPMEFYIEQMRVVFRPLIVP